MRLIIILGCVWLASAGPVPDDCDGVFFNGQYYEKDLLKFGVSAPDDLTYDKSTDTLFFSYTVRPENVVGTDFLTAAYLNLNTKEFHDIQVPGGAGSLTIDAKNNVIYFGSPKGIYKYNPDTKKAEFVTAKDVQILFINYENVLYYVADPNRQLFRYDGNDTKLLSGKNSDDIYSFIDDVDHGYFLIKNMFTDLYRGVGETEPADHYTPPETEFTYRGFAKDNNNNVFIYGNDGVYLPNRAEKKLDKVADIKSVFSVTFDKDNNVIYSDFDNIYKLTRGEYKCTPSA